MNDQPRGVSGELMADGLGFQPRVGEPETSGVTGHSGSLAAYAGVGAQSMPDTSGPGPTALQQPVPWNYDFNPADGIARATFNGEVIPSGGGPGGGVSTWNTRSGDVTLALADLLAAGGAPNSSPLFTGTPQGPTQAPGNSSIALATTAFVAQAIVANPAVQSFNGRVGAVALNLGDVTTAGGAPLASPMLSGVPQAPTAPQGTASGQLATTQYVENAIAGETVSSWNGRHGAVNLALSDVLSVGGAPINAPTFTGVPSVPTAAPGTTTAQAASTAFVTNAVSASVGGVASFNTRTGAVVLQPADIVAAGGAPIISPIFTGTPQAPTPTAGNSSNDVATTAFVATAIGGVSGGVISFNGRAGVVNLVVGDITGVGGAPIASPAFSGNPTAPTPTIGDSDTSVATTAFVATAVTTAVGALPAVPAASTTTPLADGAAAVGTGTTFARADHVHPLTAGAGKWTQIASQSVAAGAQVLFTGIPLTYGDLLITGTNMNMTGTQLNIYVSTDNGATYSTTGAAIWVGSASSNFNFVVIYHGYSNNIGCLQSITGIGTLPASPQAQPGGTTQSGWAVHTGGLNALRFAPLTGAFTAVGVITIYGK